MTVGIPHRSHRVEPVHGPSAASPGFSAGPVPAAKLGPLAPGQRWSVARQREVVLHLLRGENVELLSRELGVPIFKLEQRRQKADAALDRALKEREAEAATGPFLGGLEPQAWRSHSAQRPGVRTGLARRSHLAKISSTGTRETRS